uniref:hypothetical protein n=1 Tax=Pseudomonas viridiflava TaxID=33069 RepID=UPI00197E18AF
LLSGGVVLVGGLLVSGGSRLVLSTLHAQPGLGDASLSSDTPLSGSKTSTCGVSDAVKGRCAAHHLQRLVLKAADQVS